MKKTTKSFDWLNLLEILTIILTVSTFLILVSKVLSIFLMICGGLFLLALIVLLAAISIGIIFLTPFGSNLWYTFLGIWDMNFINNFVSTLHIACPYIVWGNLGINVIYLTLSIVEKSKKHIIISSIFSALSITMVVLHLLGIVL